MSKRKPGDEGVTSKKGFLTACLSTQAQSLIRPSTAVTCKVKEEMSVIKIFIRAESIKHF